MNNHKTTILICAGGTGGHIIPGLAIAKEFTAKGYLVHWLGTKAGLETNLVPSANIAISYISINGLRGKNLLTKLIIPVKIMLAILQSIRILLAVKPKLVIGMGGFVTGPSGIAAWLLGIPLIIHEQNAVVGTTNRILARFAKKILTGFPGCLPNLKNVYHTGNPIRADFFKVKSAEQRLIPASRPLKLLVIGGSRGALALNDCVPKAVAKLAAGTVAVWHQCGQNHLPATLAFYKDAGVNAKVVPFIDDMLAAYAWADLLVCRAGALTIAEIAAVGIASILVPFPHAIDDHQTKNAEFLQRNGAGILINQFDFKPEFLATILNDLCIDKNKMLSLATQANKLANPQALAKVIEHCLPYV